MEQIAICRNGQINEGTTGLLINTNNFGSLLGTNPPVAYIILQLINL